MVARPHCSYFCLKVSYASIPFDFCLNTLRSLGVKGQAYEWFMSYLACHSQAVCVNGCKSNTMPLNCGVPQGSVGGPTLFSIYLIGLGHILRQHKINYMYYIYADDIQLYVSFKPNQANALHALSQLEKAMNDVHSWLNSHSLKLNSAKSEFLLQWNLVIKRSDITKPSYNKVTLLVPALYISLFFYPDIMRNLIYRNKVIFMVPRTSL